MGSRLKRAFIAALLIPGLIAPAASAATTKATAKATTKATTKATAKATTKATATPKATAKTTAKATSKATAKSSATTTSTATATPKATPTKKKTTKRKKRAKVRVSPSPTPIWPPKGFIAEGEVFAKIPTSKELVGIISAQKSLAAQIAECENFLCGAVQVASETGCIWWEVITDIYGGDGKKLGVLNTVHGSSKAREIKTIIAISPESGTSGGRGKVASVLCHHEELATDAPKITYKKSE